MLEKEPSRTALAAAGHRAAHQVLEKGRIFADPLALKILGDEGEAAIRRSSDNPATRGMRFFIAARTKVAETALAEGVETRGVRQLVVLGAGLDTFAYRNPFEGRLRVFEVDHPATQAWKRRRLGEAGIGLPETLAFTPVDFERDSLLEALRAKGFDPAERSFFTWLGVVPYLTEAAIAATLRTIGGLAGGAEVVFDYSDPVATLSPAARAAHQERAARVAALGEPFLSYFEPAELHAQLATLGFARIEDIGPRGLLKRFVGPLPAALARRNRGGHVIFAATAQTPA
ncbi:MAG: SAM-dependent methyltransferase [Phenylobacterium sp.]|nr:MAG: SAM-dependent methyltransferase [Phenylobacterium sp.]